MSLPSPDATARIRGFLLRELIRDPDLDLGDDEPIFSAGLLDSFVVTRLMTFLEDEFGVRISPGSVTLADFDSIARMRDLLGRLKAASA